MTINLPVVVSLIIGLAIGYSVGYFPTIHDFYEYKLQQNKLLIQKDKEHREREQQLSINKDETIDFLFKELDKANSTERELRDVVSKLQHSLRSSSNGKSSNYCISESPGEAIREGRELLAEGSKLLEEGSKLLRENAVKHDALVNNIKQ